MEFDAVRRRYQQLNPTQRKLANFISRRSGGVPFLEAAKRADPRTLQSLRELGLVFLLPNAEAPVVAAVPLEYRFLFRNAEVEPKSLACALMRYSDATLSKMAGLRGLSMSPRWMLQADLFQSIYEELRKMDALSDDHAEVLSHVLSNGNAVEWWALQCEFDLDDRYGWDNPQEAIRGTDFGNGADPITALLAKGFLAPEQASVAPGTGWRLFIPLELVPSVKEALESRAAAMPDIETMTASAPEKALSCAESLWLDAWRIIVASLSVPVERTQSGSLADRSIKKLSKLLGLEPQSIDYYLAFLHESQVLSGRRCLSPTAALRQDPNKALEEIVASYPVWLRMVVFSESGGWRVERYRRGSRMPALRAALLSALAAMGPQWSRTDALFRVILADSKKAATAKRDHYGLAYLGEAAAKRRLKMILAFELDFLYRFGLVETDESRSVARATSRLEDALANRAPSRPSELLTSAGRPRLIVQPNLEVLAPPGTAFKTYEVLSDFGDLASVDRMVAYEFSLQSLQRGIERHGDTRLLEDLLGRDAPLPHAFSMLVQEAGSRAGELLFSPCSFIVQARRPHLGKLLETLSSAKPLEGVPGYYLMTDDIADVEALLKTLKKKGYFPLMRRESSTGGRYDNC